MSRWPINKAYFWEKAPFFRVLLPFGAGILAYYMGLLLTVPPTWYGVSAGILFIAMTGLLFSKYSHTIITFIIANLLLFAAGMSVSAFNDIRNNKAWFGNHLSPTADYVVRITTMPAAKEKSWKLQVNVIQTVDSGRATPVTGKAFVYLEKGTQPMQLHKGDTILIPGNWEAITDAGNPFEFSYATHCARNNIIFRQYCSMNAVRLTGAGNNLYAPKIGRAHV